MSASSSPGSSPAKLTYNKPALPASIANATLEELQKLFVDSLKKLKARDKKIAELNASQEAIQHQVSQSATANISLEELQQQLKSASEEAKEAQRHADDSQRQFEGMYKTCAVQQQQLEDAAVEKTIHSEQMASLKEILRTMAQEKVSAEKELQQTQDQIALLESTNQASTEQVHEAQQQLTKLQNSTSELQVQLSQALSELKHATFQHDQEVQSLHAEHTKSQQVHAAQISQLESRLRVTDEASEQASSTIAQLQQQAQSHAGTEQQLKETLQQQHVEALASLQGALTALQSKMTLTEEAKSSVNAQLKIALTAQQQHTSRNKSLSEEIASLKQELRSRESSPDPAPGDLQQQLDSAKADAAKQASKLAQAEMRASLVRQQLQEAQYQLRQLEGGAKQQPGAEHLQESFDKAHSELDMLQGRLSPIDGQASSSSSENGVTSISNSPKKVKMIINVGSGESGPEPPSVFYAEQKRTKQKLTSLKAEKQQLQKQLSSDQQTIERLSSELGEGPQQLLEAQARLQAVEQQLSQLQHTLTSARGSEAQLRSQLSSSEGTSDSLKAQLSAHQQALDSAKARSSELQQRLEATATDVTSLQEQLRSENSRRQEAQAHNDEVTTQLGQAQAEVESLQQQLLDLQQALEDKASSGDAAVSKVKHQLKAVEIDRESLQHHITTLQEALIMAQHQPTPPSSPGSPQSASAEGGDTAVERLKAEKVAMRKQLDEMQEASSQAVAAAQSAADSAQAEVQHLKSEFKTLQASFATLETERASLEEQLLAAQEDAGKAQEASTAVATLESELQQAGKREEQLRASRAQCEYQLQQAGEEAQALKQALQALQMQVVAAYMTFGGPALKTEKGQGDSPNSGIVSPAKSESSDDGDLGRSPATQAMQHQLDWLLQKLVAAEATSSEASAEADRTANHHTDPSSNGSEVTASLHSFELQHPDAAPAGEADAGVDALSNAAQAVQHGSGMSDAQEEVAELHSQTQESQFRLGASQQEADALGTRLQLQSELAAAHFQAKQADSLQQQVTQLERKLQEAQQQAEESEALRQQLADTQARVALSSGQAQGGTSIQGQANAPAAGLSGGEGADTNTLQESQLLSEVANSQEHSQELQEGDLLREQLLSVQAELEASKAAATEDAASKEQQYESLQAQFAELQDSLIAAQEAAFAAEPVKEKLVQLQADLQASQDRTAALQQLLNAQSGTLHANAHPKDTLSRNDSLQQLGLSRSTSSRQDSGGGDNEQAGPSSAHNIDQPSASMTTAEADLVEAASIAIQAQVPPGDSTVDDDISRDELAKERARLANELVDAKRKFMAVAKRKQQEYTKKIKELEDALAASQQSAAQVQSQLDTATTSGQSQATDLDAAHSRCTQLSSQLEALQAQLTQAQLEHTKTKDAMLAQEALMTSQEQQRSLQEEEVRKEMAAAQEGLAAAHKDVEADRDRFKKVIQELKKKLDRSSKESMKAEVAAAEARGKAEAEKAALQAALDSALARAQTEQSSLQLTIQRLETDAKEYKARAHTLLRQKEAELSKARESAAEQFQADVAAAEASTQRVQQLLEQAEAEVVSSSSAWEGKVEGLLKQHQQTVSDLKQRLEQQDGDVRSGNVTVEQYQAKCMSLEQRLQDLHAQQAQMPGPQQEEQHAAELQLLQQQTQRLHEESEAYRVTASSVAEAKDAELERVLASNARLRQDLASLQHVRMAAETDKGVEMSQMDAAQSTVSSPELPTSFSAGHLGPEGEEAVGWQPHSRTPAPSIMRQGSHSSYLSTSRLERASESGLLEQLMSYDNGLQEATLLRLAERQAGREEELAEACKRADAAEVRAEDLAQDLTLLQQQVAALKEVCQELERQAGRAKLAEAHGSVDLEYLKNIMLKLYETGEAAALLPVLGTVLRFSPAELKRCQAAVSAAADQLNSQQTAVARTAAASDASAADSAGYLTGWTVWPFGEDSTRKS